MLQNYFLLQWLTWASIVVPVGTQKPIVNRLNAEVVKAVNAPDVREKLIAQGFEPIGLPARHNGVLEAAPNRAQCLSC